MTEILQKSFVNIRNLPAEETIRNIRGKIVEYKEELTREKMSTNTLNIHLVSCFIKTYGISSGLSHLLYR